MELTIIVPFLNESATLNHLIYSIDNYIGNLNDKKSVELILVNDGSSDNSIEIIEQTSVNNIDVRLRFADNDDGTQQSLYLQKHFAGFHTQTAYNIGFDEEERNDTIFQNGGEQNIYSHEISFKTIDYAWLSDNDDQSLLRYHIGITQDCLCLLMTAVAKNTTCRCCYQ